MAVWGNKEKIEKEMAEFERENPSQLAGIIKRREQWEFEVKKPIYLAAKRVKLSDRNRLISISFPLGPNDDDMDSYVILQIKRGYLKFLEDEDIINQFETRFETDEFDEVYMMADVRLSPQRIMSLQREESMGNPKGPTFKFTKAGCSLEYPKRKWTLIAQPGRRQYALLDCLNNPLGAAKTIAAVFEAMRLPKDRLVRDLNDEYLGADAQEKIVRGVIREIYRKVKKSGIKKHVLRIRLEAKRVWIHIEKNVKV